MMILDYVLNGRSPVTTGDLVLKQNKNLKSTIKVYKLKEIEKGKLKLKSKKGVK